MNDEIKRLLDDFDLEPGAPAEILDTVGVKLPEDYRSFLANANGGEGFVGKQYLILWKAEELDELNREYEVSEYAPGLFIFGSSGGGEAFAFDTTVDPFTIVQIPFVGMDLEHAEPVATEFVDFLKRLKCSDGSLL